MKNLITDILQYLKDNEEARERFNEISDDKFICYGEDCYYEKLSSESPAFYQGTNNVVIFLIHALSSPNGKPICSFLEKEELKAVGTGAKICKINYAEKLFYLYIDEINEGKSHDEAYKLINKEYNKLIK